MPTTATPLRVPANDFVKKASSVASYYGFTPLEKALIERRSTAAKKPKSYGANHFRGDSLSNELIAVMKQCVNSNLASLSEPILFFNSSTQRNNLSFGLHVVGTQKSIAEAIVLRAAAAILDELSIKDASIHINSMGDKDSALKLTKELSTFFRKNIDALGPLGRQALKRDVFHALEYIHRKELALRHEAPKPMEFLSETSRRHLREVLEYLETIEIPYEINAGLVGHRDYYSQTQFEIRTDTDGKPTTLARGGRYDELARKLFRLDVPAVGIVFSCGSCSTPPAPPPQRGMRPKVFFIQLGFAAKLKSLSVVEILRQARIPMHQSLGVETLTEQLGKAEALKVPYTVIMGHKEALEGSVILRDMSSRSQNTIAIEALPEYLKTNVL